ncbi:MAG: pyruvate kinase [Bacilli bacterium]|nr:pyruvate kinase [Bacilli bacterium]
MVNKTKIVASIGPISYKNGILEKMIISGADVIRLNMGYSDYNFCKKIIDEVKQLNRELNSSVAIMLDLEGPSIKTGKFKKDRGIFKTGDKLRMYVDKRTGSDVLFSIDYDILKYLKVSQIIKLSDGKVMLKIIDVSDDYALCEVIRGGEVTSLSNVYFPGIKVSRPFLTNQDIADIKFASNMGVDYLVVSNVTSSEDVLEVNDLLIEIGNNHISILSKISNDIVLEDIDKVIDVSDGLVIARNDLVISVPIEKVPVVKNEIIYKCRMNGKVSIISADLSSFLRDEINPSRAEVSDLSTAVSLGVDAIILSSETTIGHFPVDAIKQVERVISVSEDSVDYEYFYNTSLKTEVKNIRGTIISGASSMALTLGTKGIVTTTNSGLTAKLLSRFRPPYPIIAITPSESVAKSLNIYFGVIAVVMDGYNFDMLTAKARYLSEEILKLEKGDTILIVGGHPFNEDIKTNFIKLEEI